MAIDVNDIFSEVKNSILAQPATDGIWKEKLKFEVGKEYVLRLVPFLKEGRDGLKKSLVKYQRYSWQDSSGKWHGALSPRTWGGKCPIGDYSYRIKYKGTKEEQAEMDKRLFYKAGAYANVYVIKDPTNPENEGKVKILDMGKKINALISAALDGELDKAWTEQARAYSPDKSIEVHVGPKVYDLSPNGVNLIVRVTKNQYGLNDYSTSSFSLSDTNLGKSEAEIQEIYDACHDLTTLDQKMDFDQISKLFHDTYLSDGETTTSVQQEEPKNEVPVFTAAPTTPAVSTIDTTSKVDDWFSKNGFDTSKLS